MDKWTKLYNEIKMEASNNHPLDVESCFFLKKIINDNRYKLMLEIGTGLGFSSAFFALETSLSKIITLEKREEIYNKIIKKKYSNKIQYLNVDAFEYSVDSFFDVIFIDGPKSNQILLFEKYSKFINDNGIIIIDNLMLNRVRTKKDKNSIKLIEKIDQFRMYLSSLNEFNVQFFDIGDGIAIVKKI